MYLKLGDRNSRRHTYDGSARRSDFVGNLVCNNRDYIRLYTEKYDIALAYLVNIPCARSYASGKSLCLL